MIRFYIYYFLFNSPWGWLFFIVMVFLLGCCVMGVVDFKKKKEELAPSLDADEKEAELQKVREFLDTELDGSFDVSYFDGSHQVFTTHDLPMDDTSLYKALRNRFPQLVFGIHRTLHTTPK